MGKSVPDAAIDEMLEVLDGDVMHYCSAEPTTFLEATTTFNLASKAIVGGDFANANGDVSGRKRTLTPPADASITSTGTATHVARTLAAGSLLKHVTTSTSQLLTSGGTVTGSAYAHEIGDPT